MPNDSRSPFLGAETVVRTLIVVFLGGAAVLPYARGSSVSRAAAPAAVATTFSPPAAASPAAEAATEPPQTDALTLLADFTGVDVSDTAMVEAAVRGARPDMIAAMPCVTVDDIRSALIAMKKRANPPAKTDLAADLRDTIRASRAPATCRSAQAVSDQIAADGASVDDVDGYVRLRRDDLRRERVRHALRAQAIEEPEFITVTVPDPIDSNARWTFDSATAAVQTAAGAAGFVLDRFYLPDWDPSRDVADGARRFHERWPAIILFRDSRFGPVPGTRRLLVVSLVFETPTGGIHRMALRRALDAAADWHAPSACPSIRILGPVFSGSVPSLAMTLHEFRTSHACASIRVVTGSATDSSNKDILERTSGLPAPTFRSTVLPDKIVQQKTIEFLLQSDPGLARNGSLALLLEGNTTYGKALQRDAETPPPASRPDASPVDCSRGPLSDQAACVLDHAKQFPFPLHISRLRAAADAPAQSASSVDRNRFLSFPLEEPGSSTDQIPSLTPRSTSAAVELVLANILETMERERITTIGLLATDTRDKLFLAEQVARWNPNARLFTIESDLFYAHPTYAPYVRGMIVASTYPLFSETQTWATAAAAEIQFPTTSAQGIYNALVALLRDDDGNVRPGAGGTAPDPVDYRDPDRRTGLPPVWIGVVGSDGIWPVMWHPSNGHDSTRYLQPIAAAADGTAADHGTASRANRPVAHASKAVNFGFFVLSLLVVAHVAAYALRRKTAIRGPAGSFLGFFADANLQRRRPYLLVAFLSLSLLYGYVASLFLPFVIERDPSAERIELLSAACVAVLLLALVACTVWIAWRSVRGVWHRASHLRRDVALDPQYWLMLIAAVSTITAVFFGGVYLTDATLPTSSRAIYYFGRVTHPGNGVSPLMPLVFIVAAVYLWAVVHLRRLSTVSGEALAESFRPLRGLKLDGLVAAARRLQQFIDSAVQALPRWLTAAALLAGLVAAYFALMRPLTSPEPVAFTRSFRAAWLLLQVLLLVTFAHVIYFWMLLREALDPFDGTPMVAAFDRLPVHLVRDRLSPQHPQIADIRRLSRFAQQLGHAMSDILRRAPKAAAVYADFGLDATQYQELASLCRREIPPADEGTRTWTDTAEWRGLLEVVKRLSHVVGRFWRSRMRESLLSSADFDGEVAGVTGDSQRWMLRAEDFLAMQVLLLIRELLARLANVFFYIVIGVLLMVAAAQSFPFQPRQELLGTAWVYVVSAVLLVVTIFFQMERHPVLSAVASTEAGKIRWDAALWSKLFVYAVVPIATVFAAQFPQIGSSIIGWLTPMQGVLP